MAKDQLFAEAVAAYKNGEPWWPDAHFEPEHIRPQQEARQDIDVWEEPIAEYLNGRRRVTVLEVARNAVLIDADSKVGRAEQTPFTRILQSLKWKPGNRSGKARWQRARCDGVTQMTDIPYRGVCVCVCPLRIVRHVSHCVMRQAPIAF